MHEQSRQSLGPGSIVQSTTVPEVKSAVCGLPQERWLPPPFWSAGGVQRRFTGLAHAHRRALRGMQYFFLTWEVLAKGPRNGEGTGRHRHGPVPGGIAQRVPRRAGV